MKAFLVVDIPEEWANKRLVDVRLMDIFEGSFTLYQQKIRPLPKERKHGDPEEIIWDDDIYALGYNRCLHEITGETK